MKKSANIRKPAGKVSRKAKGSTKAKVARKGAHKASPATKAPTVKAKSLAKAKASASVKRAKLVAKAKARRESRPEAEQQWGTGLHLDMTAIVRKVVPNAANKRGASRVRFLGYKVGKSLQWHTDMNAKRPTAYPNRHDYKYDADRRFITLSKNPVGLVKKYPAFVIRKPA